MREFSFLEKDHSRPKRMLDMARQRFRERYTWMRNEVERFDVDYEDFEFEAGDEYIIDMPSWRVFLEEDGYNLQSKDDREYSPGRGVLEHVVIQDLSELYRKYD